MKRLFMFIAVMALATFGLSCGNDDVSEGRQLELESDVITAKVGSTITFNVNYRKAAITDAEISGSNGAVVENYKFTPTESGEYTFTTKKKGFNDSNVVKITVLEGDDTQGRDEDKVLYAYFESDKIEKEKDLYVILVNKAFSYKVLDFSGKPVVGAQLYEGKKKVEGVVTDSNGIVSFPDGKDKAITTELFFEKDGVKTNVLKIRTDIDTPGKISYNNRNHGLQAALLSYEAVDKKDGPPFIFIPKGSDVGYYIWEIVVYGIFTGKDFKNKFTITFATEAKIGSKEKPVLTKDSQLYYINSTYVAMDDEFLSSERISNRGRIILKEIDFDSKAIHFTVESYDLGIKVEFKDTLRGIYGKYDPPTTK